MPTDKSMDGVGEPARYAFAINPDDVSNFAVITRAIYVGSGGDIAAVMYPSGDVVTFVGAVTGSILPIRCKRVNSTGTTAASLVGLY